MGTELSDEIAKQFSAFFGKRAEIRVNGKHAIINRKKSEAMYEFLPVNNTLVVRNVSPNPNDYDLVCDILMLNESAARILGYKQMNYDASGEIDKAVARGLGYIFGKGNVGVKQL